MVVIKRYCDLCGKEIPDGNSVYSFEVNDSMGNCIEDPEGVCADCMDKVFKTIDLCRRQKENDR